MPLKNSYFNCLFAAFLIICGQNAVFAQGSQIDFNSIPKSGTALVYSHQDDDLIWMLPFWKITEKFIGGAMPATPNFRTIVSQQQSFLNSNGYNIDYESNWLTPWDDISNNEYSYYYWNDDPNYSYLVLDHLETRLATNTTPMSTYEINKIKAKIEQYIASPSVSRVITHNNWGEYGHQHHRALNKAVRELAVKYRKDVWMLGCTIWNYIFNDISVPNGITYTMGSFNTPDLFTGIRTIYRNNNRWTWYVDQVPSGDHPFIKIVDGGSDKSYILRGDAITYPGPSQLEPGAYIFDGDDDYLTLEGNNNSSFTIAMRIRPDQIRAMDIASMSEYPLSTRNDRNLYITDDGHITARIFDGSSKVVTSNSIVPAGTWTHVAITGNGNSLKLYINGITEGTVQSGTAISNYSNPEFILGQATETSNYFEGQISNVNFYNYALTDNEIATLSGMVFTITSGTGTGGTIEPSGNTAVVVGTDKTFAITPDIGYKISDVTVDNVSQGAISTYTFTNVRSNHSISAIFTPAPTFNIIASAGEGGSITPSAIVVVNEGSNQNFTITPALGFRISDVKIDDISAGAVSSYSFTGITADHTISAFFESTPTYTISVTSGNGGSITPGGTVTVNEGTNQSFTVKPDAGYRISEVLADGISAGAVSSYSFSNITSNHSISATFSILTYTLTATAGSGGSITPSGSISLDHGTSQTYTIIPNSGYRISNVMVDNASVGTPSEYTFTGISANHTITASFSIITNEINAFAGTGGSISPQGNVSVNYGANQTFSISAGTGYFISDVKVDDVSAGPVTSYAFSNVTSTHTIEAIFSPVTYTISAVAGSGGSISPAGNVTVNHGSNRTFNISPAFGFQVADVRIDNISVGSVSSFTFSNITTNHTISATFETAEYSINASSGSGGSISPSGTYTAIHGTSLTYTVVPATGYRISDLRVDNVSAGAIASYTFNNITSNHTISATFAIITYSLTASATTGGSVSPSGVSTVNFGTNRTFSITPNAGYYISDVTVDNVSVGPLTTYTFSNITGNHSISASFLVFSYNISSQAGTGGSISPSGVSRVNHGSSLAYTIAPDEGFLISDVKIDNVSAGDIPSYRFNNVTSEHTISALFIPITFTISVNHGPGGTISSTGTITVNYGTAHTVSIIPDIGYQIDDVIIDNNSVGKISTYTFSNVKGDHSISASFSIIKYSVTAESNSGGSVNPSGTTVVNYGSKMTFAFTPDYGYRISDVRVDGISAGSITSYSFNNITDNHSISVIFKPIATFSISASPGKGGSITPDGSVTIFEGSEQTYAIIPDNDYRILDVLVDNKSIGPVPEYTFTNIASNHSISAMFTTSIDVKVYPNPFIGEFSIYIASPEGFLYDLSIADINGKIVYTRKKIEGNTVVPVDLKVPQGYYILRIFTGGWKIATIKVIKS